MVKTGFSGPRGPGAFWWNWNVDDGSYAGSDDFLSPQWKHPSNSLIQGFCGFPVLGFLGHGFGGPGSSGLGGLVPAGDGGGLMAATC